MSSSLANSVAAAATTDTRVGKRYAAYSAALLLWASGCGSGVVDVGDLPGAGTGDAGVPRLPAVDAGGGQTPGGGCAIANLGQYRLVFDSDGGKLERRIYSMRADGSELMPLTPVGELAREPAVSPDGTQLAYATPEGIKLLDLGSGQAELVVPDADQPNWSADGARLTYRHGVAPYSTLATLRMSERVNEEHVGGGYYCSSPEVTPDSSGLVYADETYREGIEIQSGVKTYSWETYDVREIVPSSLIRISYPTVSLDGIWVAAAFQCAGTTHSSLWASPFAVTTEACEGRRISRAGAVTATNPKWGPGVLIAYERSEPPRDIAIVAADTGDECAIERLGDDRNPSWVPDVFSSPQ